MPVGQTGQTDIQRIYDTLDERRQAIFQSAVPGNTRDQVLIPVQNAQTAFKIQNALAQIIDVSKDTQIVDGKGVIVTNKEFAKNFWPVINEIKNPTVKLNPDPHAGNRADGASKGNFLTEDERRDAALKAQYETNKALNAGTKEPAAVQHPKETAPPPPSAPAAATNPVQQALTEKRITDIHAKNISNAIIDHTGGKVEVHPNSLGKVHAFLTESGVKANDIAIITKDGKTYLQVTGEDSLGKLKDVRLQAAQHLDPSLKPATYAPGTGPGFRVKDHEDYDRNAAKTTAEIRQENLLSQHAANKAVNATPPPHQDFRYTGTDKTHLRVGGTTGATQEQRYGAGAGSANGYTGGLRAAAAELARQQQGTSPSAPAQTPPMERAAPDYMRSGERITTLQKPSVQLATTTQAYFSEGEYNRIRTGLGQLAQNPKLSGANSLLTATINNTSLTAAQQAELNAGLKQAGLGHLASDDINQLRNNCRDIAAVQKNISAKNPLEFFKKDIDGRPADPATYKGTLENRSQQVLGSLDSRQKTAIAAYVEKGVPLDPALKEKLTSANLINTSDDTLKPGVRTALQENLKTEIAKLNAPAPNPAKSNGYNAQPINPDGTANRMGIPNNGRVGGIVVGNDPKAYLEARGIEAKPGQVSVTPNGGVQNLKTVFAEAAAQGTPEQKTSLAITKITTPSPHAAPASATPPATTSTPTPPAPGTPEPVKQGGATNAAASTMASTMTTGARVLTTGMGGAALASGTIGTINALKEGDNVGAAVHGTTAAAGAGTLLSTTTTMSPGLSAAFQRAGMVGMVAGTALEVSREKQMEDKINAGVKGVVTAGAGMATGAVMAGGTATLATVAAPVVVAGTVGYAAKKIIDDDKANRAEFQESLKKTASTTATFKHGVTDLSGKPTIGDYGNLRSFQAKHPELAKLGIHDFSKPENMAKLEQALKDEVKAQTKIKNDNTSIIPDLMRPGSGVSDRMAAENKLARLEATQKELAKFKEDLGNFENKKSAPASEKQAPKQPENVPANITKAPRSAPVQTAENATPSRISAADQYGASENSLRASLDVDLQKSFTEAAAGNIDMPEPAAPEAGVGLTQQQTRVSTAPGLA